MSFNIEECVFMSVVVIVVVVLVSKRSRVE
uniref:Uncharacterized protein n=1 Tax=Lepeophtheirus salmonis TaxID=72036 RepID=A0A0K2UZN7_LEPSM